MTNNNLTYSHVAKVFKLPVKAIAMLYKDGIINNMPPDGYEMTALVVLSKIWGKDTFVKLQLSRFTKSKRRRIAESADLTKSESYALNRFINHRIEKITNPKKKLGISEVVEEIGYNYNIRITKELNKLVNRMRWRAYKFDISKM